MKKIQGVSIRTILDMLVYSLDELQYLKIDDSELNKCNSLNDILSILLNKSIDNIKSLGLLREYTPKRNCSNKPSGRLLVYESIASGKYQIGQLEFIKSSYSYDILQNQIIKTALHILNNYGSSGITSDEQKQQIVENLELFNYVSVLDYKYIDIEKLEVKRMDDYYRPAITASILIIKEAQLMGEDGSSPVFSLSDEERLEYIFEKFVRQYYTLDYTEHNIRVTHNSYKTTGDNIKTMIPDMVINSENNYVVIDTKWYNRNDSLPANFYQVTAYGEAVLSRYPNANCIVGIVLYSNVRRLRMKSGTLSNTQISSSGKIPLYEVSLDLNKTFDNIKLDLNKILSYALEKAKSWNN